MHFFKWGCLSVYRSGTWLVGWLGGWLVHWLVHLYVQYARASASASGEVRLSIHLTSDYLSHIA